MEVILNVNSIMQNFRKHKKNTGVADFRRPFGSEDMLKIIVDGHQDLVNNLAFYEVVKSEKLIKKNNL